MIVETLPTFTFLQLHMGWYNKPMSGNFRKSTGRAWILMRVTNEAVKGFFCFTASRFTDYKCFASARVWITGRPGCCFCRSCVSLAPPRQMGKSFFALILSVSKVKQLNRFIIYFWINPNHLLSFLFTKIFTEMQRFELLFI